MFDAPAFKVLAANDTGSTRGHQGGMVIPKAIEEYFPDVQGVIGPSTPTADVKVKATLVVGGQVVDNVETRYQHQTWGGTRSPERRLTGNLGALRNLATAGDIALFERNLDDLQSMRITLVRQTDSDFARLAPLMAGKSTGVISTFGVAPVRNSEIATEQTQLGALAALPFSAFTAQRRSAVIRVEKKARNVAFRTLVLDQYAQRCAITGLRIRDLDDASNVEAAHIVPVELNGTDDPRNGIALSRDLHWAFDRGVIYIDQERKVAVSRKVLSVPDNHHLGALAGRPILVTRDAHLQPHDDALAWHRQHRAVI